MSAGYQINDQEGLFYLTFQIVVTGYWFAMENGVICSHRLQFRSGEVKKTSPSAWTLRKSSIHLLTLNDNYGKK